MKVLLVCAHPEPDSFNGALRNVAVQTLIAAGHEVQVSDLYAMQFNPVSDRRNFTTVKNPRFLKPQAEEVFASETNGFAPELEAEIQKLLWCDLMIWQFPLWWFGLPAILKGWVDRVFAMGRAYGYGHVYETGLLRGKRAMLSLTTGGPLDNYIEGGLNGDMNGILRPIHRGMLHFTGFEVLRPEVHYSAARVDEDQRRRWLDQWAGRLASVHNETPIDPGQY